MPELTEEQLDVINSEDDLILVNACAGSGKTTTLFEFAKKRIWKKILYLTFNKSMREEAEIKFADTPWVKVKTTHGFAFQYEGAVYKEKLSMGYRVLNVADALGLDFNDPKEFWKASLIFEMFTKYLASSERKLEECPWYSEYFKNEKFEIDNYNFELNEVMTLFKKIWSLMNDGEVDVIHDFYLKKFQLSTRVFNEYDYVLLDEAQDTNDVVLDIVVKKFPSAKVVIVGDTNQQIYAWRGAVDALKKIVGKEYNLTHSFRIGDEAAHIANAILKKFKRYEITIKGLNSNQKLVEQVDKGKLRTYLCRTRAMVFDNAVQALKRKEKIYFEGGYESYNFRQFIEAYYFSTGKKPSDMLLKKFPSYRNLKEYALNAEDLELKFMVSMVEKHKEKVVDYVNKIRDVSVKDKEVADVILSTVHRAKGLEYEEVILENDFIELTITDELLTKKEMSYDSIVEEINILYVALTRSKGNLIINENLKNYFKGRFGESKEGNKYEVGKEIIHVSYGRGTIVGLKSNYVEVLFPGHSKKKFLLALADKMFYKPRS